MHRSDCSSQRLFIRQLPRFGQGDGTTRAALSWFACRGDVCSGAVCDDHDVARPPRRRDHAALLAWARWAAANVAAV